MRRLIFLAVVLGIMNVPISTPTSAQSLEQFLAPLLNPPSRVKEPGYPRRYIPENERRYLDPNHGSGREVSTEPAMDLSTRKMVQEALRRQGVYNGDIDGGLGRASRRAIEAYQLQNGFSATGYLTEAQLTDLTRLARQEPMLAPKNTPLPTGSNFANSDVVFDTRRNDEASRTENARLGYELIRRTVAANPKLIDDDKQVRDWLRDFAYGAYALNPTREIIELYEVVSKQDEFRQRDALNRFRDLLRREATTAPLEIVRVRQAELGRFDFNNSVFPLGSKIDSYNFDHEMLVQGQGWSGMTVETESWRPLNLMPFPATGAQALVEKVSSNGLRLVDVALHMSIENFQQRSGVPQNGVVAKAILKGASVHLAQRANDQKLGERLATLTLVSDLEASKQVSQPAASTLESWTRLGAIGANGTIVLRSNVPTDLDGMAKPLRLLAGVKSSDTAKSTDLIEYLTKNFLPEVNYRSLFPTGYDYRVKHQIEQDVFRKKDISEEFQRNFLTQLKSLEPVFPVPALITWPIELRHYNFATKSFEFSSGIAWEKRAPYIDIRLDSNSTLPPIFPDVERLPTSLEMDEVSARALSQKLRSRSGGEQMRLYAALNLDFIALSAAALSDRVAEPHPRMRGTLVASANKLAVYADPQLKELIHEFDLSAFRPAKPMVQEPEFGEPLAKTVPLSSWSLLSLAQTSGLPAEFTTKMLKQNQAYRSANEFERQRVLERLESRVQTEKPEGNTPLFLKGEVTLGEYDAQRGSFAISSSSYQTEDLSGEVVDIDGIRIATENAGAVTRFALASGPARRLVELNKSRRFPAVFQIKALRAQVISDNPADPKAQLDLFVERIILLAPDNKARVWASADYGSAVADTVQKPIATPDKVVLDQETLALLIYRHSDTQPTEAELRDLLRMRWEAERGVQRLVESNDPAPFGRFFPPGYRSLSKSDEDRLLPSFTTWNQARLSALPAKITFERVLNDYLSPESNYFSSPRQYDGLLEGLGVSRQNFAALATNLLQKKQSGNGDELTGGIVAAQLTRAGPMNTEPEAFFILPSIKVPSGQLSKIAAVSIDLTIRRAEVGAKRQSDGVRPVAFDTSVSEVRWFSDKTAVSPRKLLATTKPDPEPLRKPIAPLSLDVVGLKIGMTQAEAEAALANHMVIDRVLELPPPQATSPQIIPVAARLYINDSSTDLIAVHYGPAALPPKVYGVARTLHLPQQEVTDDQILASLIKKYTKPMTGDWVWGNTSTIYSCVTGGNPSEVDWRGANVIKGGPINSEPIDLMGKVNGKAISDDPSLAQEALLAARIARLAWGLGAPSSYDLSCGPSVAAKSSRFSMGSADRFVPEASRQTLITWLRDHTAEQAALKEALSAQQVESPKPSAIDLKL
ncbi:peptidoglycan-binding protein [Agrobacterium genomosp. 3]|uniref:peptidoglycan-binding domain-containing protein n=1 Tax=Agrobacterium tomkonis TaxID=1183410 RepID=UPI001CD898B9|nr:peptidoglycan-binding protein [Agrobacterium tomkonis]MCA1879743.1 peptidoglycan-binding protein [Agrobacterium tumefaciens]MCA1894963.1 peptidoglycan-binding protein [Agrobacterium tomkonis]